MAISVGQIIAFSSLIDSFFTVVQGLLYLAYIVISVGIVGANLNTFIEEIAPEVYSPLYTPLYFQCNRFIHPQ